VPVPGKPTWTEWVKRALGVNIRTVQLWLKEPGEKLSRGRKKGKRPEGDTTRIELVLSKAEAEQLIAAGKKRNPDDTHYGIYQAAIGGTSLQLGDVEGLLSFTYEPIAAVLAPLRQADPDSFLVDLRKYFQHIVDRLAGGPDRLQVVVFPNLDEVASGQRKERPSLTAFRRHTEQRSNNKPKKPARDRGTDFAVIRGRKSK